MIGELEDLLRYYRREAAGETDSVRAETWRRAANLLEGVIAVVSRQRRRLVPPDPPPRYDEVFEEGVEWLDKL